MHLTQEKVDRALALAVEESGGDRATGFGLLLIAVGACIATAAPEERAHALEMVVSASLPTAS